MAFLPICVKPWQAFARCRPADVAPQRGRWSQGGRSASCPSLTRDWGAHSPATPRFRGSRSLPAGAGVGVHLLSLCFRSFSPARAWIAAWPCLLDCWRILNCSLLESLFVYMYYMHSSCTHWQTNMYVYIYLYIYACLFRYLCIVRQKYPVVAIGQDEMQFVAGPLIWSSALNLTGHKAW